MILVLNREIDIGCFDKNNFYDSFFLWVYDGWLEVWSHILLDSAVVSIFLQILFISGL